MLLLPEGDLKLGDDSIEAEAGGDLFISIEEGARIIFILLLTLLLLFFFFN